MSPGAGQYRVLDKGQGMNYRMRASSDGILPSSNTSPLQGHYTQMQQPPIEMYQSHGGSSTARDAYDMGSAGVAASAMYSPLSARERPAPSLFDGMQMQAGAGQPQQQRLVSHVSDSNLRPAAGPAQWNPNSGQWCTLMPFGRKLTAITRSRVVLYPRNSLTWQEV